jgi:PucR C-terminal helix-turn-helix domain/GGDEF-like domain
VRDLQAMMLDAVLEGEGLGGIATLAAAEAGGPVAIVLPARGLAVASPEDAAADDVVAYVTAGLANGAAARPASVELELPVMIGGEELGAVLALSANGSDTASGLRLDRDEVLRAAAFACLAEVAALDARDRLASEVRGGLLEDLQENRIAADEAVRRAARLGCDLAAGGVGLVAAVSSGRPRYVAALIESELPGAVAEALSDQRVYAIVPAGGSEEGGERALAAAAAMVRRLRPHGLAASSSLYSDPSELHRALTEAELALEVVSADERLAEGIANGLAGGVYRLLFRALASNPEEVRRFYDDTVAALVGHDREYRTDLLGTLESYLANDCNMNATARAVFAHRHTVAHRLERVRELTGLDPSVSEDRERLGLGVKAYRILAPTLQR